MGSYLAPFEDVSKQAWSRLIKACALSFVIHVTLLVGIPVNPTGGVPSVVSVITARLEPAAPAESEPAAENASLVPADTVTPPAAVSPPKSIEPAPAAKPEPPRASAPPSSPSGGIDVPLIRDPTYYPAKQLDVYPQPLAPIRLAYPDPAAKARVDGRLMVLLLIDEFGMVNDASVVEAQPEGYFEEAALAEFRSARFSPAQKQGHAVKSRVLLQVKYVYGESAGAAR
jgi:protein TonB